jgi:hypothetical protein
LSVPDVQRADNHTTASTPQGTDALGDGAPLRTHETRAATRRKLALSNDSITSLTHPKVDTIRDGTDMDTDNTCTNSGDASAERKHAHTENEHAVQAEGYIALNEEVSATSGDLDMIVVTERNIPESEVAMRILTNISSPVTESSNTKTKLK